MRKCGASGTFSIPTYRCSFFRNCNMCLLGIWLSGAFLNLFFLVEYLHNGPTLPKSLVIVWNTRIQPCTVFSSVLIYVIVLAWIAWQRCVKSGIFKNFTFQIKWCFQTR